MKHATLIVALVALLLSGGQIFANRRDRIERAAVLAGLTERVDALATSARARAGADELAGRLERAESGLDELEERVRALDSARERVAVHPSAPERSATDGTDAPSPAPDAERDAPSASRAEQEEFAAHLDRLLGFDLDLHGSPEELERFWRLARTTGVVDARVAELEAAVERDPTNTDLRMELARTYVAKLFTVPGGPEQGLWGERAELQWQTVLEHDPENWDAQFTLANNWGYYPDFMGKTNDAIAGLERARAIQERRPPEPAHVQTYISLSRLYQRKGDEQRVRAVLQAGLSYFPGDEKLLAALGELDGQVNH
jgi:tetratricopeptide (TPR) repeat protein